MAKNENTPQAPRRWTPKEAQRVIGRLMIPAMLLAVVAIYFQWILLLIPAGLIWVAALLILYRYWRCPKCGKTLPKTGKVHECPKCGAKID